MADGWLDEACEAARKRLAAVDAEVKAYLRAGDAHAVVRLEPMLTPAVYRHADMDLVPDDAPAIEVTMEPMRESSAPVVLDPEPRVYVDVGPAVGDAVGAAASILARAVREGFREVQILVQPQIDVHVPPAQVTMEAAPAPEVTVNVPTPQVTVNVPPAQVAVAAPQITVEAPHVTVEAPVPAPVERTVRKEIVRDAAGKITGTVETSLGGDAGAAPLPVADQTVSKQIVRGRDGRVAEVVETRTETSRALRKRIVRDADGKIVGVEETVEQDMVPPKNAGAKRVLSAQ